MVTWLSSLYLIWSITTSFWTTGLTGVLLYTWECNVEQESLDYLAAVWNILQGLMKFDVLIIPMNPVPISYIKRIFVYVVLWEIVVVL